MATHYLDRELISHARKVCSLYKRMSRDIEWWEGDFFEQRFKKLQLRAQFDQHKNINDMREAKMILNEGERKFHKEINPYNAQGTPKHPFSKEGIAYSRNVESPDYVVDTWHPLEKARYPYFFAKREEMKEEYINLWKKTMMKPGETDKPDRS